MPYSNNFGIPLSLAIWLTYDTYDHDSDPNVISVTSLLKPLRAIILSRSIPADKTVDLMDLVPSKMGVAIHDSIEQAWRAELYSSKLKQIGMANSVIDRLEVNPTVIDPNNFNVFVERRAKKKMGKFILSGKFDIVVDGVLEDFKSTSIWNWIFQSSKDDYILQESMYRFLNQDIITADYANISYIFTDWSATASKREKDYPAHKVMVKKYPLMSVEATEAYIINRLDQIERLEDAGTDSLPQCTKEELWQGDTVWKYYRNPASTARSTRNFDSLAQANDRLRSDGNVGVVLEVKGKAKRCTYCNASPVCTQREQLQTDDLL